MFPAVAVVQAARNRPSFEVEVLHVGTESAVEQRILKAAAIPSRTLDIKGLRGGGPARVSLQGMKLAAAVAPAWRIVKDFNPQATLATGGYVSVPVVLASRLARCPVVLFSADVSAGLAIRLVARLAQRIAVPVAEAARGLPAGHIVVTGYPVRPDLQSLMSRQEAKRQLGFAPDDPLLLCFGGSQGAHTLNEALREGLPRLLPHTQILHLSGAADAPDLLPLANARYRVEAFIDEMPVALAAADLCISRAGASVLGELPAAGLPAILVPYPFAGGHQIANAEVLTRAGGAVMLDNEDVAQGRLVAATMDLLSNTSQRQAMADAMRRQARPHAAEEILHLAEELSLAA